LIALLAGGCFFFEPIGFSGGAGDTGWTPACDLPPSAPTEGIADCLSGATASGAPAADGAWVGGFCIGGSGAWGSLQLHDVCVGDADLRLAADDSPPIGGSGACAFEGGGLFTIRPLLPDTYSGAVEGVWGEAGAATGTIEVGYADLMIRGDWRGSHCDGLIAGDMVGASELTYEGETITFEYEGLFAVGFVPSDDPPGDTGDQR